MAERSKARVHRQTAPLSRTKKVTSVRGKTSTSRRPAAKKVNKGNYKKVVHEGKVFDSAQWTVCYGELQKPKRPGPKPKNETPHLFRFVGEKLPYSSLKSVEKHVRNVLGETPNGVYLAHDSMGCPRYIGRGAIFSRLAARKEKQQLELEYFSFYVVADKRHEREVETLLIRSSSFLLQFNTRKKRVGIGPGNIMDYEPGTLFYERHYKKGKKAAPTKKK
jgi:hypothetical protein